MITGRYRVLLGRNEPIVFPGYDPRKQIPARVDTGAYRSAIHCSDAKVVEKDGKKVLTGTLLAGHPCGLGAAYPFKTTKFDIVTVANSFGDKEQRYEIDLKCKLGPPVFKTVFTLADRSKKLFPILIGRRALWKRFVVDVTKSNIDRTELKSIFECNNPEDDDTLIDK